MKTDRIGKRKVEGGIQKRRKRRGRFKVGKTGRSRMKGGT